MEDKYSIGKVHKVFPNKLVIEIPDKREIHYVYKGEFFKTEGINTFITIYGTMDKLFVYQIIGLYEQEKPLIEEESAKLSSHAYFECTPIGEISNEKFEFGMLNYPMIGDKVFLTSTKELDIIFEKGNFSIELGRIPSQDNYSPHINLDDLFTHHMTILGNTNSGKSTTARKIIQSLSQNKKIKQESLNFFIFDIHDEYRFLNSEIMKSVSMDEIAISLEDLTIEDWVNLVRPADRVQLPILKQALRLANVIEKNQNWREAIIAYCALELFNNQSTDNLAKRNSVINLLEKTTFKEETHFDIEEKYEFSFGKMTPIHRSEFINKIDDFIKCRIKESYSNFYNELQDSLSKTSESVNSFPKLLESIDLLFIIEESHGNKNIRSHTSTLITRIEELKSNYEKNLFSRNKDKQIKLSNLLELKINEPFIRFDVSELNNEDLLFFTSHILERVYRNQVKQRRNSKKMLVHFIFDEAHQYIRDSSQEERLQSLSVFEKIAREGRKFGLFMILISQRPSELSQTVLSQCNNYILHRIRNSVDLEFMRKSIPYITSHQLTRLSFLKSGTAILVGEAFSIPIELEVIASDDIKTPSKTYLPSDLWKDNRRREKCGS